ncbi:diguanylate cyclase, partial [Candidatus Omnitrophota bacterium]
MKEKLNILVVDDDRLISENLRLILSEEGYAVAVANKGVDSVEKVKKQFFNVILLDLVLPDIGGIELLRMFSQKTPESCFIISTGYASLGSAIEALKAGAYDYITKPFDVDQVKLVIKRGIERQGLALENRELIDRLQKRRRKLEIILKAYNDISGIYNLDYLSDLVTGTAIQLVEAEKSSLMVLDDASGELVVRGNKGIKQKESPWKIKMGDLIAGWVAQEGEELLVEDIDRDLRLKLYAKNRKYKTKSFISLPLKTDSRIIGVMNVADKLAGMGIFTQEDLEYLRILAHQTVAQVANIMLCDKLSSLAVTDALTNIFNHRYFQERIEVETVRAQRYKRAMSLILFDIDLFKTYNDRYGHLEGDRVLKEVARIMKQNLRQVDIVCRYGGEEFAVILPEIDSRQAKLVADKIRKAVEKESKGMFDKDVKIVAEEIRKAVHEERKLKKVLGVTISGGVANYKEGLLKDELISRADKA